MATPLEGTDSENRTTTGGLPKFWVDYRRNRKQNTQPREGGWSEAVVMSDAMNGSVNILNIANMMLVESIMVQDVQTSDSCRLGR